MKERQIIIKIINEDGKERIETKVNGVPIKELIAVLEKTKHIVLQSELGGGRITNIRSQI